MRNSSSPHPDHGSSGNVALIVAAALALAAAVVFVVGMGVIMAGGMGGGMMGMMNRAGNSPQTPAVATASEVAVEIRNFDYTPRDLTVPAGARVTWTNYDAAPHTATAKGQWDTGILDKGDSATLTFDQPGTYEYFCLVHPSMKASLTVRP
ncbi:MAG: cupredoxin family copper-binding protein [Chloroflexi bacterium]|nr:cupredoxin family copper-binding protein [Chloroflexota bacterium]